MSRKKFDTTLRPRKPSRFWHFLQNVIQFFYLAPVGGKITKVNCENLEYPYIMLCNHGSMVDFAMAVKAVDPHSTSWVASIDEFIHREFMFRKMGVIYKRKFTNDLTVVRHIMHAIVRNESSMTFYPEARFSIIGVNERLDKALGKLAKKAKVPVVMLMLTGNFLRSPQWNKHPYRNVKVSGVMTQIVSKEEVETLTADEIQKRIEDHFVYDEYRWQYENKIEIKSKKRAENLHKVLYQCPHCKTEFKMYSKGSKIWCEECGKVWEMDYYGQLHCENGEDYFPLVSDWYRWERQNVREEVRSGNYKFEDKARLEILKSTHDGLVPHGEVTLTHDYNGFTMEGTADGKPFSFNRPPETMYSCHIEYNYKKRGDAIDLCTPNDTYFAYPLTAFNSLTKLHLATEEIHDYIMEKKQEERK